jgi:hypothetical protein
MQRNAHWGSEVEWGENIDRAFLGRLRNSPNNEAVRKTKSQKKELVSIVFKKRWIPEFDPNGRGILNECAGKLNFFRA